MSKKSKCNHEFCEPFLSVFKNGDEHAKVICNKCKFKTFVHWHRLCLNRQPKRTIGFQKKEEYVPKDRM